jgi:hypothetical protein
MIRGLVEFALNNRFLVLAAAAQNLVPYGHGTLRSRAQRKRS